VINFGDLFKGSSDLINTGKKIAKEYKTKKQQSKYTFDAEAGVYRKPEDKFAYCPKCFHDKRFVPMQETRHEYICPYCGTDKPIPGAPSRYEGYEPSINPRTNW